MSELTYTPEFEFHRPLGFLPGIPAPGVGLVQPIGASLPTKFKGLEAFPSAFQKASEDQRQTSSCTGNALIALKENLTFRQTGKWVNLSRLFPYARGRGRRGWLKQDGGALISDVFAVAGEEGTCLESFWPFEESLLFTDPDDAAKRQAARHKLVNPRRVARGALAEVLSGLGDPEKSRPVVGGVIVHQTSWFGSVATRTGWIEVPTGSYGGWHAILLHGYDANEDTYDGVTSWGDKYAFESVVGKPGHIRLPGAYIRNSQWSMDFWTGDALVTQGDEA